MDAAFSHTIIDSPLGELTVVAESGQVSGLFFARHWYRPAASTFGARRDDAGPFADARTQLAEYFAGSRRVFDLPLRARGTGFQQRVWALLADIPYGATTTYGDLAREVGDVALARDVGAAVGRNPLSVLVPCHRVIGKDGRLTGYAGGLRRKRELLDLEGSVVGSVATLF
ncbi:MAG: methylated-DNA-[protein]-cysteine S-methyltransferase [Pseudonocardiales bacterium]|jgi:methylated-DNA-[protein]-cysteine S-methyltransferase|nr:methylated-DNA-[protein]-cysteine S-methyltransferase [Pseudonocardiales bacterium]